LTRARDSERGRGRDAAPLVRPLVNRRSAVGSAEGFASLKGPQRGPMKPSVVTALQTTEKRQRERERRAIVINVIQVSREGRNEDRNRRVGV
jgi:hypothetical protein